MVGSHPRRVLSLFDSTNLIVGIIVGAGVFVTAPEVARGVGSGWGVIAIWVLGGALSLCGAVGYAELATTYPEQGGDYVYLTRAYGRWAGFLFGWLQTLVVRPGDIAVMAYVFATYAEPVVGRIWGGKPVLAAMVVVLLTLINMAGVRFGVRTQNSLTVAKLAGVLAVVGVAVVVRGGPAGGMPQVLGVEPLPVSVALILVLFSFGGWNEMVFVAAEVKNPKRNIVRAMMLGMAVVTAIYLAVNTAFMRVLGFPGLASSEAVAAETVASAFPQSAGILVELLICLCALGAVNGLIFAGSRIAYAVGKDHRLFGALGHWSSRTGTPVRSLALQGTLAVALILALGSFIDTVMYTAAAVYLFYLATSIAVIVLRVREPQTPRTYRAAGFPATTVVFCLVCAFLIVAAVDYRPVMAAASLGVILLGVPVFWLSELSGRRRTSSRRPGWDLPSAVSSCGRDRGNSAAGKRESAVNIKKTNRRMWTAMVILVGVVLAVQGCDSKSRRIERFESGLHLQPKMDVRHLFDSDPAGQQLEERMAEHGVPGLTVTVIDDRRIDWSKTWGIRNASTGDPVTPDTIFEAASTSKLATATLVMMMVEEGDLALDEPVNDQLTSWRIPDNDFTANAPVTLRMLLAHISGMNRPASIYAFEEGSMPTLLDVLNGEAPAINDPATIEAVPGTRHSYSNIAYNVIQLLIEDVTGKPFSDVMRERVFKPLGMDSCTYEFPFSDETLARVALPHDGDMKAHMNDLLPTALAHGGLLCTSEDLAKLGVELLRTYSGESSRLMSRATFLEMLSDQHEPEDEIGGFNGQGLGLFTLSDENTLYFAHQGYNVPGTCCLLMANPETGDGLVVMANGASGFDLIFEIIAGLADLYDWPEVETTAD